MNSKGVGLKSSSTTGSGSTTQQLERYRLLVESIQDYAIFLLDTTGHIASWNPGAQRFKGYRADEIIGKHFSIFYPSEEKYTKPAKELEEAKKNGRVEDEGWRVRKDGSRFWANVVITALFDDDGKLQGFAKVTRDMSDRKAMEDQLERANTELIQRQKEMALLNEAKDEFISLASHQLRTPATGVKQYLNLILEGFLGDVPAKILNAVQKADESNERQIELVNDLLQVAQLDAGKIVLNPTNIDIVDIIKDVLLEQKDKFTERKHQTFLHVSHSGPVIVSADTRRLRMVFENLVDNACKYTPEAGKVSVEVFADNQQATIAIKDTGVGIKNEDMPLLFHKFSRIKNQLSDKVGGSGLGLYWAKRVIELHGGRIDVRSQHGLGTEFAVVLPRDQHV